MRIGTTGNRPAETNLERIYWLVDSGYLECLRLEPVDYRGQLPSAVFDDISSTVAGEFWITDRVANRLARQQAQATLTEGATWSLGWLLGLGTAVAAALFAVLVALGIGKAARR